MLFQPRATLEGLAILLGLTQNQTLSKQAVAKRLSRSCLHFIQEVLMIALRSATAVSPVLDTAVFASFGRVLIQDSTCFGLPAHLAHLYPGCRNQHRSGIAYAVLRLQAVYDLLTDQCLHFSCSPYTRNDQMASPDILALARPGDLVLRDLGYFVLGVFEQMQQQGIFSFHASVPACICILRKVSDGNGPSSPAPLHLWMKQSVWAKSNASRFAWSPVPSRLRLPRNGGDGYIGIPGIAAPVKSGWPCSTGTYSLPMCPTRSGRPPKP